MTQFMEGQDVEVLTTVSSCGNADLPYWRKAKIVSVHEQINLWPGSAYEVQFPDGTRSVSDTKHIRALFTGFTCEVDYP
jgi:hypothetical protein